jgi:hypothetical protein
VFIGTIRKKDLVHIREHIIIYQSEADNIRYVFGP